MALVRVRPLTQALDPSRDVVGIQTQMDRLFDNLFAQRGMMERAWTPPVDMYETENEVVVTVRRQRQGYVLTVNLPKTEGVKPKEIKIDAV